MTRFVNTGFARNSSREGQKSNISGAIRTAGLFAVVALSLALAGCATNSAPFPAVADVRAVTEPKPKPTADILTDPAASDRYNAAIEARGDRIYAAGVRLCRFFQRTGMQGLDCPAATGDATP